MKLESMWVGEPRRLDPPIQAWVMVDWVFVNPMSPVAPVMTYARGTSVTLEMFVPASSNEPFGFPFFWGSDGKPYAAWILEEKKQ